MIQSQSPKRRPTLQFVITFARRKIAKPMRFLSDKLNPTQRLAFLSVGIGICTGVMALVLKSAVHYLEKFVSSLGDFPHRGITSTSSLPVQLLSGLPLLITPAIGILLTILLVRHIVRDDISHGVTKVLRSIAVGKGEMPRHSVWSYVIACSLTTGFGGSVGMEAPILATGSGIGSNIARFFHLPYRHKVVLIGCGAAAAVAAIFKAPIAGLIIALEVLAIDSTAWAIMPILLASVSAALVSIGFSSGAIEFYFSVHHDFSPSNIPWYIILGVITGLIAVLFSRVSWRIENIFKPWGRWKRFLLGAGMVGILIFLCPPLFGEGYSAMKALLSGHPELLQTNPLYTGLLAMDFGSNDPAIKAWFFVVFLVLTLLLKIIATPITNAAGGVGGIFAPSLFIGCIAGTSLARIVNLSGIPAFFGINPAPELNMALVGMAGVLSGVMHAPLTAIFLIAEITGGYGLFIPLIITSTIAFYTIKRYEKYSVYTVKLANDGQLLTQEKDRSALKLLRINQFIRNDAPVISPSTTLAKIVPLISASDSEILIVTEGDMFKGLIMIADIRPIIFVPESYHVASAHDLLEFPKRILHPDMPMADVMDAFNCGHISGEDSPQSIPYLPVLDREGKYVGFVSHADVLEAYRQKMLEISSYSEE